MEWISEARYDKKRFFFSVKLTTESRHRENCSKIAVTYLHALKLGSSKSHVKKGGLPSGLNTLKQSKWFVEIKAHTSRPARWILINLPYINCMLSGITELNAEYKCSFCLGEWNKKLLRIPIGSHRHMMLQLRVFWIHSSIPTLEQSTKKSL